MFLNKNNIQYEEQFAFSPNHSVTHALSETAENMKQGCDSGKYACEVFLHLQMASNTVNYDILLKKIKPLWNKRNCKQLILFIFKRQNAI